MGHKCSSDNLRTAAGIAACRTACAPAHCCQADIGSANCGYAACGSYDGCNALVSVANVDVSGADGADGGDGGNGSDGSDGVVDQDDIENNGDTALAEDGEMTTADVDTSSTDAGDGTFNEPEDGSLLDAVVNAGSTIEDTELNDYDSIDYDLLNQFGVESKEDQYSGDGEVWEDAALVDRADAAADDAAGKKKRQKGGKSKSEGTLGGAADDVEVSAVLKSKKEGKTKGSTVAAVSAAMEANAATDPSPFSTGQIVGIAVGVFVAVCMLIRIIKWCCCRKKVD